MMIARLGILAALMGLAATAHAAEPFATTAPKVENAKEKIFELQFPETASNNFREALVILQFDVLATGKVANIKLAEGGFHDKRFVDATIRALEKSTWQPKRVDGKPVDSVGLSQSYAYWDPEVPPGIKPEFRKELVKVGEMLDKGDFAGAQSHTEKILKEKVTLIYEYAVLQAQLADTYARMGKTKEATTSAWKATARRSGALPQFFQLQTSVPKNNASNYLLPKQIVVNLLQLRMRLLANQGLSLEAVQTYYELAGLVELKPTDPLVALANQLASQIKGPGKLVGKVEVGQSGSWRQHLSRRRFALENVGGPIESLSLVCSATPRTTLQYTAGIIYSVPEGSGVCAASVGAAPGTKLDFVEYPDLPAAEPGP